MTITENGGLRSSWKLDESLVVARSLEVLLVPHGWHVALGGGVMLRGESRKDLDVLIYPRDSRVRNLRAVRRELRDIGWTLWRSAAQVRKHWRKIGSGDRKHVEVWMTGRGKRVDLMVMFVEVRP